MNDADLGVNTPTLAASAIITLGVGLAAAFGEFLTLSVPVPVGFLLLMFALIILPTGDLMRLTSEWVDAARPDKSESDEHPNQVDKR